MTTDLDRLIEAVEVGNDAAFRQYNRAVFATPAQDVGLQLREDDSYRAYRDSIDAAVTLLEALLPEARWVLDYRKDWSTAYVISPRNTPPTEEARRSPARALLLATLRAYRGVRGANHG